VLLSDVKQAAVWGQHAQQWSRVGPPLKPSAEDADLTLLGLQSVFAQHPNMCQVAILGVTPELVLLPWPDFVHLFAFDHSAEMIAQVWQPHPVVISSVHEADWRKFPLETGSIQAAVGDGSLNVLPHLQDYRAVLEELHRVMAPGAVLVIRCFIRPDKVETLPEVIAAVHASQVGSFHALKWRCAMSLADVPGASVAVSDIHAAFETSFPSRLLLSEMTGWPEAQIDTIDAYKGAPTRYNFPTLQEMRDRCAPYFDVEDVRYAIYEMADRCPTLILKRRGLDEVKP
jgi:SAM-dependent methyltransferase